MKNKRGNSFLFILNIFLLIQYIALVYLCLARFDFIPWYASDASFILYYVMWLPLCITTLITIVVSFFTKKFNRTAVMLLCFNAMLLPLFFAADFVGYTALDYILATIGLITVVSYSIICIKSLLK